MFTVSDDGGKLVLEVLCGGSGMYTVEHWLSDEEAALFQSVPAELADLARSLCG